MATCSGDLDRNNLDLLRLILASIVALFHLLVLTELPAFAFLGKYLSPHFAVRSFFVISGMLVYKSYLRSSSARSYFEKRVRRIYPAYFTVILGSALTLFVVSSVPASQYFQWGFWKYLGANLLFLNFLAPSLPGVFTANSNPAVNGALWTLKLEVLFYLAVPLLAYWCRRFGATITLVGVCAASCIWKYGLLWLDIRHGSSTATSRSLYSELQVQFPGQLIYFVAGILMLLHFERLRHHFVSITVITACSYIVDHFLGREALDVIWISGVILLFGFWRYWGNFAKYGDFSYGVYILHWPLLQLMIALGSTRITPPVFFLLAVSLIFAAALLMWHSVERRFLARRPHYHQAAVRVVMANEVVQCE